MTLAIALLGAWNEDEAPAGEGTVNNNAARKQLEIA